MYTPPMFKPDRAAALRLPSARISAPYALGRQQGRSPRRCHFTSAMPMTATPRAAFHVARGNPLAKLADGTTSWLMAVNGADAYVSADWYASPDQVPTWLYQAVHLTGTVRRMSESELGSASRRAERQVRRLARAEAPWTASKMTAGRLDGMKKAIVGLLMAVDDVEGSFKLNQHKSDADHAAIAAALARQPEAAAQVLAAEMRALRPHLVAATTPLTDTALPEGTM